MRVLACLACALAIGCGSGSGGGGGTGGTGGGGTGGTGGGGGTGGTGGGGGTGGTGGSGGGGGMAMGPPVTITGAVVAAGGGGGGNPPVAGVTVTLVGTTTTATTDAMGNYSMMVPSGGPIFLQMAKTGYQTSEFGYVVPAAGGTVPTPNFLTNATVMQAMSSLNPAMTLDTSKGDVILQFKDSTMTAGYGATLSAAHDNTWVPGNNGGSSMYSNTTLGGQSQQPLIFPNTVAGTTTITVTTPSGKTCTPDQAITNWRVDPNVFTWVIYTCM